MIDLFGYWSNVTTLVFLLLFPLIFVIPYIVYHFVKVVTEDEELAEKTQHKILQYEPVDKSRSSQHYTYNLSCVWLVFNKYIIQEGWIIGAAIVGGISWVASLIYWGDGGQREIGTPYWEALIVNVSEVAMFVLPVTSWLSVATVLYVVAVFVSRKLWKLSVKINEVIDKVEDK